MAYLELASPKQQRTWGWPAVVNLALGGSGAGLYLLGTFFSVLDQPWPLEMQLVVPNPGSGHRMSGFYRLAHGSRKAFAGLPLVQQFKRLLDGCRKSGRRRICCHGGHQPVFRRFYLRHPGGGNGFLADPQPGYDGFSGHGGQSLEPKTDPAALCDIRFDDRLWFFPLEYSGSFRVGQAPHDRFSRYYRLQPHFLAALSLPETRPGFQDKSQVFEASAFVDGYRGLRPPCSGCASFSNRKHRNGFVVIGRFGFNHRPGIGWLWIGPEGRHHHGRGFVSRTGLAR